MIFKKRRVWQKEKGFLKNKGFLFTISIIFFASTLVFFAQAYSNINNQNERLIVSSSRPLSAFYLNNDLANDLERIFNTGFEVNYDNNTRINIVGTFSSEPYFAQQLDVYDDFLANGMFGASIGSKQVNFLGLSDGAAEVFFGPSFELINNYSQKKLEFFSFNAVNLHRIDAKLRAFNDLNSLSCSIGGAGNSVLSINYSDDSNNFSSLIGFNEDLLSYCTFIYPDSNITLSFGRLGDGKEGGISIESSNNQRVDYEVSFLYDSIIATPVKWNALLRYNDNQTDSNSYIISLR